MFYICRKSASSISAFLYALAAKRPIPFPLTASNDVTDDKDADSVPFTSLPCRWKPPRKRKESILKISDATFEKHMYGKAKKIKHLPIENYDPRPEKYRNKVDSHKKFLVLYMVRDWVCPYCWIHVRGAGRQSPASSTSFRITKYKAGTIIEFEKSLNITREIRGNTRSQRDSPEWFAARRYRITASIFGLIYCRKPDTPPDALVARLLEQRQSTSSAIK